jgi:hypothetical protein
LRNTRNANDPEPFQITGQISGQIPALPTDAAVVGVALDQAERRTLREHGEFRLQGNKGGQGHRLQRRA